LIFLIVEMSPSDAVALLYQNHHFEDLVMVLSDVRECGEEEATDIASRIAVMISEVCSVQALEEFSPGRHE
jgi:hypothetical protein